MTKQKQSKTEHNRTEKNITKHSTTEESRVKQNRYIYKFNTNLHRNDSWIGTVITLDTVKTLPRMINGNTRISLPVLLHTIFGFNLPHGINYKRI